MLSGLNVVSVILFRQRGAVRYRMLRPDGRKCRCDAFGAAVEKWVVLVCGRQSLTGLVSVRYEPSLGSMLFKILLKQHTHTCMCAHASIQRCLGPGALHSTEKLLSCASNIDSQCLPIPTEDECRKGRPSAVNMGQSLQAGGGLWRYTGLESCTPGCIKRARIKEKPG